jgi:hypothetical protein
MDCIYRFAGGRKMFAQYLAVALLTGMAAVLRPDFWEYALAVCGVLGVTVGSIAWEDGRRAQAGARVESGEASPGYRRPPEWRPEPTPEVDEP